MKLRVVLSWACIVTLAAAGAPRPVAAGDEWLEVQVVVQDAIDLAAFEAELVYDPQVISLGDIEYGPLVPPESVPLGPVQVDGGAVAVGSYNPRGKTESGSRSLALLSFQVIGDGAHGLRLVPASTGVFDTNGFALGAEVRLIVGEPGAAFLPYLASED